MDSIYTDQGDALDKFSNKHYFDLQSNRSDSIHSVSDVESDSTVNYNLIIGHTKHRHNENDICKENNSNIICKICLNKSGKNDNFIILSCNHTFHITCLANVHFSDIYKFAVIDSDYFASRKCLTCNTCLQTEELLFLHSKFLTGTKSMIETHDNSIKKLELQLKNLKDELRTCYEYKHKLEQDREKSKQIVSTLTTMM